MKFVIEINNKTAELLVRQSISRTLRRLKSKHACVKKHVSVYIKKDGVDVLKDKPARSVQLETEATKHIKSCHPIRIVLGSVPICIRLTRTQHGNKD